MKRADAEGKPEADRGDDAGGMGVGKLVENVAEPAVLVTLLSALCFVAGDAYHAAYYEDAGLPPDEIRLPPAEHVRTGFWVLLLFGLFGGATLALVYALLALYARAFAYGIARTKRKSPEKAALVEARAPRFERLLATLREHAFAFTVLQLTAFFLVEGILGTGAPLVRWRLASVVGLLSLVAFILYALRLALVERVGVLTKLRSGTPAAQVAIALLLVALAALFGGLAGGEAAEDASRSFGDERVALTLESGEEETWWLLAHHEGRYYVKREPWCAEVFAFDESRVVSARYVEPTGWGPCEGEDGPR